MWKGFFLCNLLTSLSGLVSTQACARGREDPSVIVGAGLPNQISLRGRSALGEPAPRESGEMSKQSSIDVLRQRLMKVITDEGRSEAEEFKPRSTDIFVTGFLKSGTTWMQQIVHQLRTGGDMDFADIMEVIPIPDLAHGLGQDLNMEQKASPRCFKDHQPYHTCQRGARYIWCVREPCAVAYSYFKMSQGWFFQPGEVSLEDFIRELWLVGQLSIKTSYFQHLASWWPHRNDPNILVVFFEDLKESYESSVRSVAEFMGITDEDCIQVALARGTFEFMKQHSDKFDQILLKQRSNVRCGLPASAGMGQSKIRTGSATEGLKMVPLEIRNEIQKKWEAVVTPVTGCASYPELRAMWRKEKQNK